MYSDDVFRNHLERVIGDLEKWSADYHDELSDDALDVIIESARGAERWSTVGCSENIIEASWLALCDALELALLRPAVDD